MRYLTHQFAHLETLERARRWLVHAGFDPSQIHAVTDGIPRIAVILNPGQGVEAELIIDAAELTDPEGPPSFWDLARQQHIHAIHTETQAVPQNMEARTFVVGYRLSDERPELGTSVTAIEMRDAYIGWLGD
jgi:hypothetical protein